MRDGEDEYIVLVGGDGTVGAFCAVFEYLGLYLIYVVEGDGCWFGEERKFGRVGCYLVLGE